MEMQARQDIAEKMRLHEQQQLEVQKAYHEGQIGLGMQKLQEANAIARAKAEAAAGQFADEAALAQHIAGGGKMAEGLMKYSRARPQFIHALQQTVPSPEYMPQEITLPSGKRVIANTHTGHFIANEGDGVNVTLPIDPNDPIGGGKVTRRMPLADVYKLAGTNAPNLFPSGPPAAPGCTEYPCRSGASISLQPQSQKDREHLRSVQPAIDIPAFTKNNDDEMSKLVEVPNLGTVEFPDDTPDEAISSSITDHLDRVGKKAALGEEMAATRRERFAGDVGEAFLSGAEAGTKVVAGMSPIQAISNFGTALGTSITNS
jgi:hypothetical protein